MEWIIGLAVALLLVGTAVYFIILYNRLVALKHNVAEAWSNIDVLLKQRNEELPKLVNTAKEYMGYEQETLQQVIAARNQAEDARQKGSAQELGAAEQSLRQGLGQVFALAEDYPDLKASQSFQQLQARVSDLENQIADRREYYNQSVNNNNIRIEQFPDVIIARNLGFGAFDLLELDAAETANPDLGELFGKA